ncbi:MAG: tRNA (guanosine(37)-N1)-methyltransferase TrmD, partial [Mycoplasmatales bacterium]
MIKINVLTIFPELYYPMFEQTVLKKAIAKEKIKINLIDIRQYSTNKHKKVDDYPYGGGEGMLLTVQPIDEAIIQNNLQHSRMLFTSPKGQVIKQDLLYDLRNRQEEITILVGRYEGVDQRVLDKYNFEEISIG